MLVMLVQLLVMHWFPPTRPVGDVSDKPKLSPLIRRSAAPLDAQLTRPTPEINGALYVYELSKVPSRLLKIMTELRPDPAPLGELATMVVAVTHEAVELIVPPR